jgi:hypothetical protein
MYKSSEVEGFTEVFQGNTR